MSRISVEPRARCLRPTDEAVLDRGDTERATRVASRLRRLADDQANGEVRAAVDALDAVLSPVP